MSQEFDNNELGLVKQKGFYPYDYMSDFEKFEEIMPSKEKFHISLMFSMFGISLNWKPWNIIATFI